jgi:hypothetical protein
MPIEDLIATRRRKNRDCLVMCPVCHNGRLLLGRAARGGSTRDFGDCLLDA